MPRKLYVTDEMGLDDALADIAAVNLSGALMWPWIIPYFDDWGRAEASARRIKTRIFPYFDEITVDTVEAMLEAFAQAGLIRLYMDGGKRYMAIDREKWFRFQTHIHASKRTSEGSRYPALPNSVLAEAKQPSAELRGNPRNCAETLKKQPATENRGTPRNSAENRASPSPSPSPSPSLSPSLSPSERLITIGAPAGASSQAIKKTTRNGTRNANQAEAVTVASTLTEKKEEPEPESRQEAETPQEQNRAVDPYLLALLRQAQVLTNADPSPSPPDPGPPLVTMSAAATRVFDLALAASQQAEPQSIGGPV